MSIETRTTELHRPYVWGHLMMHQFNGEICEERQTVKDLRCRFQCFMNCEVTVKYKFNSHRFLNWNRDSRNDPRHETIHVLTWCSWIFFLILSDVGSKSAILKLACKYMCNKIPKIGSDLSFSPIFYHNAFSFPKNVNFKYFNPNQKHVLSGWKWIQKDPRWLSSLYQSNT